MTFCVLACNQLSFSQMNKDGHFGCLPDVIYGSCLTVNGKNFSICICLATNVEGCQSIGEKMLSELSSNNNPLLPDIDYADAFCELFNIISGSVVRKYLADDDFLDLSVPFFINDNLQVQKKFGN